MAEYHEESPVIKGDDLVKDTGKREAKASRRKFIRNAAVGAVGAGAALALQGENSVEAQSESGEVSVDGVLLNYVCAPENSGGGGRLTLTQTFTNTFRLSLASGAGVTITTSTMVNQPSGNFVGGTQTFTQGVSSQVSAAIMVRSTTSYTLNSGIGQVDKTKFFGLLRHRLKLVGDRSVLNFKFLNVNAGTFSATAADLRNPMFNPGLSQNTINSILAQYLPLADPTGANLTTPRFKKKGFRSVGSEPDSLDFVISNGSSFSLGKTVTFSSQITDSMGFMDPMLRTEFSAGRNFNIQLTSVQEITSERIATLHFDLINNSGRTKVWRFYRDRVFKNWVLIDETRPIATTGQPVIEGTVRDMYGNPIARAVVSVTQNNIEFSTRTNSAGYYQIATPQGEALTTGYKTVYSGGQGQSVYVGSGTSYADIYGADPNQAQNPVYRDDHFVLE